VIEGMKKLLARNRCIAQVEIWDEPDGESDRRFKRLAAGLVRQGNTFMRAIRLRSG
jgi:hypothetical protein